MGPVPVVFTYRVTAVRSAAAALVLATTGDVRDSEALNAVVAYLIACPLLRDPLALPAICVA
jgi:hypothetical protein